MEPLHVRFEFFEALDSKKSLLLCEMSLINIAKKIQEYKELRQEELAKKVLIRARIRDMLKEMKALKSNLPRTKIPEIEKEEIAEKIAEKTKKSSLEFELREIRDRLEKLSA